MEVGFIKSLVGDYEAAYEADENTITFDNPSRFSAYNFAEFNWETGVLCLIKIDGEGNEKEVKRFKVTATLAPVEEA